MSIILNSLGSLGVIGAAFGLGLALAAKKFHVKVDPNIEKIDEVLPGANCGACGLPGCGGYAAAIVNDKMDITLCAPGGPDVVAKIAEIMGMKADASARKIAVVHCKGHKEYCEDKYEYSGINTCLAVASVNNGNKMCNYGCLGMGDCVASCPFDAMEMGENGLPIVFEDKCTGCGNCVKACPRGLMSLIPEWQKVYLGCSNPERGKAVSDVCKVGCVGCTLCTKPAFNPAGIVKMKGALPELTPTEDNKDFGKVVESCPVGKKTESCYVKRT